MVSEFSITLFVAFSSPELPIPDANQSILAPVVSEIARIDEIVGVNLFLSQSLICCLCRPHTLAKSVCVKSNNPRKYFNLVEISLFIVKALTPRLCIAYNVSMFTDSNNIVSQKAETKNGNTPAPAGRCGNALEIKAALVRRGITCREIALAASVNPSYVSLTIHGYRKNQRIRQAIADALGVQATELWPEN